MRIAFVLACAALGCASVAPMEANPPRGAAIARAEAEIHAAEQAGPREGDTASLYLALARHDLDEARRCTSRGDVDGGERYLERVEIDAEIATLIAREAAVRAAVQQSDAEAEALAEELDRASTRMK